VVGAATGTNFGVRGIAASNLGGVGVYGESPNRGIQGVALSTSGQSIGVGPGYGVWAAANNSNGTGVFGESAITSGSGKGVVGVSSAASGTGVVAQAINQASTAIGVFGQASTGMGVIGHVGTRGPPTPSAKSGVFGQCDIDGSSHGVFGRSSAGYGVRARTSSGVGLFAEATGASGTGLKVNGKTVFSRSGKATVLAGNVSIAVGSVILTSSSLVLATIQEAGESGVYVRNVSLNIAGSSFTITMAKAVAANTIVAWFIVN
jgi:hypothetical protein